MTNQYRFTRPPKGLTRPDIQLDNFSLVSASMLAHMGEYKTLSDRQPKGTAILILPSATSPLRRVYVAVARMMRERGRLVRCYTVQRSSTESMRGR